MFFKKFYVNSCNSIWVSRNWIEMTHMTLFKTFIVSVMITYQSVHATRQFFFVIHPEPSE